MGCRAFAIAWAMVAVPILAQNRILDSYVGRDLSEDAGSGYADLDEIVGTVSDDVTVHPLPWHVWKTTQDVETRYVVLLARHLLTIPGGIWACVRLFDSGGHRIASWTFRSGWRADFSGASFEYSPRLGCDVMILRTEAAFGGRDITREFFALKHNKLTFVRLENSGGSLVSNNYVLPNYEIGVVPDAKSVSEWIRLLQSEDKADILSALVFLSGSHTARPGIWSAGPMESKYVEKYRELIHDPNVLRIVERLSNRGDDWIKNAATLALERGTGRIE